MGGEKFCPKCGADLRAVGSEQGAGGTIETGAPDASNPSPQNNAQQNFQGNGAAPSTPYSPPYQPAQNQNFAQTGAPQKKKKKLWVGVVLVAVVLVAVGGFIFINRKPFGGSYLSQTTIGVAKTKIPDILKFKNGKIRETVDGVDEGEIGTYTVSGNKLTMIIDSEKSTSTLSWDNNSFVSKPNKREIEHKIHRTKYIRQQE